MNLIKEYVLGEIKKNDNDPTFLSNLDGFLQRMIDVNEGSLSKDLVMVKAGRQLLCCIGIDIKSNLIPSSHYVTIFRKIDFTSFSMQARQSFIKAIIDNNLYFKDIERSVTNEYRLIVFPIADHKYYIDGRIAGIHGISSIEIIYEELVEYLKSNQILFKDKLLYKGNGLSHYWTTMEKEIEDIKMSSRAPARDTVDRLGLSHFTFTEEGETYFCYFDLGQAPIESYRPNATLINWNWPEGGFLSYIKDYAGRTFSISGYSNYANGIKERVFNRYELTDEEQSRTRINVFDDKIEPPIIPNLDELLDEGFKRFSLA